MATRYFALVSGIVVLLLGVLSFVPTFTTSVPLHAPNLAVDANYSYLFGIFPVNVVLNVIQIAIGVLGIMAYRDHTQARTFSRGLAVAYAVMAVMGLFPVLNTTFGIMPLFGNDIWLHALIALPAAYFGYARQTDMVFSDQAHRPI